MDVVDFWQPFEKEISTFDELVEVINKLAERSQKRGIQFAWRGLVCADWALHSSLYRRMALTKGNTLKEKEFASEEDKILVNLHRWGLHWSDQSGRLSILNQLAMLQHYGAPTRLVDITFNAWIGAWFAVEKKWDNGQPIMEDSDARLFAIDVTDRLINENAEWRQWEDSLVKPWGNSYTPKVDKNFWTTNVFAWKPPNLDGRIAAQNGGFLFGGVAGSIKPDGKRFQFPKGDQNGFWKIEDAHKACCLALRPHKFDPKHGGVTTGALYTFRIKASAKNEIRHRLEKLFGYTHATIYPDYTGFSSFGVSHLKERP